MVRFILALGVTVMLVVFGDCNLMGIPTRLSSGEDELVRLINKFRPTPHDGPEQRSFLNKIVDDFEKIAIAALKPAEYLADKTLDLVPEFIRDQFRAIFPGTEWCGNGNRSKSSEEVGYFSTTDLCCMAHDKCSLNLPAGASGFGLLNDGIFTRSHCSCDLSFYHCLKEAASDIAFAIGKTYFDILRPQCFCKKADGCPIPTPLISGEDSANQTVRWCDNLFF